MLTRTLLMVRHGESEGNAARMFTGHGASPLTALGARQAEAVAGASATSCIAPTTARAPAHRSARGRPRAPSWEMEP